MQYSDLVFMVMRPPTPPCLMSPASHLEAARGRGPAYCCPTGPLSFPLETLLALWVTRPPSPPCCVLLLASGFPRGQSKGSPSGNSERGREVRWRGSSGTPPRGVAAGWRCPSAPISVLSAQLLHVCLSRHLLPPCPSDLCVAWSRALLSPSCVLHT